MKTSAPSVEALLVEANEKLDAAIEELVRRPCSPQAASLSEIATLLQSAAACGRNFLARDRSASQIGVLLRNISVRAARVQRLLDAAAAFYQGCISAHCSAPSGYAADGQWIPSAGPGRFRIEA